MNKVKKGTVVGFTDLSKEDWNDIANGRDNEFEEIECENCDGRGWHGNSITCVCCKGSGKIQIKRMNTVCKEHEWVDSAVAFPANEQHPIIATFCSKCGIHKPKTDFHIKDNIEVVNKQEWEDIWREFCFSPIKQNIKVEEFLPEFWEWLKENYFCPEKKNT